MRFDVFYELSVPAFAGRSEPQVYRETLEEIALADRLGYDTAWLVEHHFMREYSHCSAPELVLAAAAQHTRHLRLGHGIIPLPYSHPVHVAERLATLDILSGGRVEFGFGRGFSPREYESFGIDMAESRSRTEESLQIIRQAFRREPVHFDGRHFRLNGVEVLPHILQRPHPPIWSAAVSPESFEFAAREGIGVLVGPFKPWFMVREDVRRYRADWQRFHGSGAARPDQNPRVGMTVGIFCLRDAGAARDAAREGITWFYRELIRQTYPVLERLYESYEYYRRMGRLRGLLDRAVNLTVLETLGMVVVGDPAHCIRRLEALAEAGVDHVLCAVGAGVLPTELTRESLRVIAEDVMPAFRD
jgi:alkanesulfonate monooxygenase SsuD/methylene tetrahydromethanopterin reductase-like flavin-dependent oxidoreductase (luciferase family)